MQNLLLLLKFCDANKDRMLRGKSNPICAESFFFSFVMLTRIDCWEGKIGPDAFYSTSSDRLGLCV